MSAREEILARVRGAVADVTTPAGARGPAPTVETTAVGPAETLALFAENVADYRATVVRVEPQDVAAEIAAALRANGCRSVVLPTGVEPSWRDAVAEVAQVLPEAEAATAAELDAIDAVVTGSAVGIATTGTIVLDHTADQGRRALTLVPDTHVCVVRADQVVHDVPDAVARLRPAAEGPRPQTWISGPSATSDIELERVEGVHGPRTLVVIIVSNAGDGE
ncbi:MULTISPECIES: LutC/YkgG family protein [Microbacterium]|uniref:LutC/YkgG family protein n=1 Tax=Microbacterium TaxID=33882 RepID=UPI00217D32C1|nr:MULTISPECIES: LUD domain-containing protein [Microbacterium]UWF77983.1 LUD domain-containing protein [Microbacterium neungamense]WCM56161.1 LUD domain-containing protein [Microbacterium sp. EF45047]